jgi:hypothetical protein
MVDGKVKLLDDEAIGIGVVVQPLLNPMHE